MAKRKKYRHGKRTHDYYTQNCNVKHILLNQIFRGNKDAFINFICNAASIEMYEGEIGKVYLSSPFSFWLNNKSPQWDDDKYHERMKHARVYFRKTREC